jgi:hypothetical protein
LSASESFGKHDPPYPIPARRNGAIGVQADACATVVTSAPVASQTFAISLMNEMR